MRRLGFVLVALLLAAPLAHAGQATVTYDDAAMASALAPPPARPAPPGRAVVAPAAPTLTPQQYIQRLVDANLRQHQMQDQMRLFRACQGGDAAACAQIKPPPK